MEREKTADRWEEVKRNVTRSIEEFDDDVIFIKEVKTPETTPSPQGSRLYKPTRQGKSRQRYPQSVATGRRNKAPPKKTLADFMPPTPPGSESEDWDRDIAREADAREALAAARVDI